MNQIRISCILSLLILISACSPSRIYLPEDKINAVEVPGGSMARMWGDELPSNMEVRIEVLTRQFADRHDTDVFTNPPTYLGLSGGGARGAFRAGLLKGWTESGTCPEMFVVSGISTGALIAPFAFLGPEYDDELEKFLYQHVDRGPDCRTFYHPRLVQRFDLRHPTAVSAARYSCSRSSSISSQLQSVSASAAGKWFTSSEPRGLETCIEFIWAYRVMTSIASWHLYPRNSRTRVASSSIPIS